LAGDSVLGLNVSKSLRHPQPPRRPSGGRNGLATKGGAPVVTAHVMSGNCRPNLDPELASILFCDAMILAFIALVQSGLDGPQNEPRCGLTLVAAHSAIQSGRPFQVALVFDIEPGWHIYWRNPGDSGVPTQVAWKLPSGFKVTGTEWTRPVRFSPGGITSYGYEKQAAIVATVQPSAAKSGTANLGANADWLICKESCVIGKGFASLRLPIQAATPKPNPKWQAIADDLPAVKHALVFSARSSKDTYELKVGHSTHKGVGTATAYFYPYDEELAAHSEPQTLTVRSGGFALAIPRSRLEKGTAKRLRGVLEFGWNSDELSAVTVDVPVTNP
jgi:DsbC/DsbD-like thiol-disulfide interchange protein